MKLPNADRAIIDIRKLSTYCLDLEHSDGQHKARVFRSALGIGLEDAEELRTALLEAILTSETVPTQQDRHGQRYVVDFLMVRLDKQALVRSVWIIRTTENFPRLVTCYIP